MQTKRKSPLALLWGSQQRMVTGQSPTGSTNGFCVQDASPGPGKASEEPPKVSIDKKPGFRGSLVPEE